MFKWNKITLQSNGLNEMVFKPYVWLKCAHASILPLSYFHFVNPFLDQPMPISFPRQFLQLFFVVIFFTAVLFVFYFLSFFLSLSLSSLSVFYIYSIYVLFSDLCIGSVAVQRLLFLLAIFPPQKSRAIFFIHPSENEKQPTQFCVKWPLTLLLSHIFCIKSNEPDGGE